MVSQVYWRVTNFPSLLIEEWEDGFTVFQPDSGKTHFLNPVAMRVLQTLHSAPDGMLAEDVIDASLMTLFESDGSRALESEAEATLAQLDELGLIEPLTKEAACDN
jgi:PqqD family protein of HPr-rel-A system